MAKIKKLYKKTGKNTKVLIYPATITQAIKDGETGQNLHDYMNDVKPKFKFNGTQTDGQLVEVGSIQISQDRGETWNDISPKFINNLRIQGYVASTSALPTGQAVGTIYGVGPTYATEDTAQTNPIYRLYVYNGTTWVDNGQFTSIAAGVVQETGNSETEVMSQKAVSEKLTELGSKGAIYLFDTITAEIGRGNRIRIIYYLPANTKFKCHAPTPGIAASLYKTINEAFIANAGTEIETYTYNNYTTSVVENKLSTTGFLCISLRKNDNTTITDEDCVALIDGLSLSIKNNNNYEDYSNTLNRELTNKVIANEKDTKARLSYDTINSGYEVTNPYMGRVVRNIINNSNESKKGNRLKIVFYVPGRTKIHIETTELEGIVAAVEVYSTFDSSIAAIIADRLELISSYNTSMSGIANKEGYLVISLKKEDESAFSDDEVSNCLGKIKISLCGVNKPTQLVNKSLTDLDITDESGNVIMRMKKGHIQTKYFNSKEVVDILYRIEYLTLTASDFEQGSYTDGVENVTTNRIRAKELIKVSEGDRIDIEANGQYVYIHFFDVNGNFVEGKFQTEWLGTDRTIYITENGSIAVIVCTSVEIPKAITPDGLMSKIVITYSSNDTLDEYVKQLEESIDYIIPPYWKSYIDNKLQTLRSVNSSIGRDGVSFVFITDTHWEDNYKQSPAVIDYIRKKMYIGDVVFGGDVITAHGDKDSKLEELFGWAKLTKSFNCVNLVGNHDYNTSDQPSDSWEENRITEGEFYRNMMAQTEKDVMYASNSVEGEYNEQYGYEDNISQKVRYIYLDSGCVHIPNWLDSNLRISETQLTWMKERIQELSEEWSVIIFTHIFFHSPNKVISLHGIGQQIMSVLDDIYDTVSATIIGVVCGHCHMSYSMYSDKGYPIIATTNDARKPSQVIDGIISTKGTVSEQAFDLYFINKSNRTIDVIRIGAGDNEQDRSFTY